MKKSSKKVLEEAYQVVEQWAESYKNAGDINLNNFLLALKQYDDQRFFEHYAHGLDRALAQLRKEKAI
jgi:hypothetical protein